MGGGLMQLVAYGAQDIYLTGNPQITFFKVVYRRHTNFSMETIEQTVNGTSQLTSSGGSSTVTISRNGDLVHKVYVNLTGTGASGQAVPQSGLAYLKDVELEIGGQRIDKHTSNWMANWFELNTPTSRAYETGLMMATTHECAAKAESWGRKGNWNVGSGPEVAQIPLLFWFCRNPGLALPLIALQYHEVKLKFNWNGQTAGPDCSVLCDYIYLDTDERRRFAQVSHEYLIEQVQEQSESLTADSANNIRLNFNHPVKELIWNVGTVATASSLFTTPPDKFDFTGKLQLNGHDRFSEQKQEYFCLRQPLDYHTSVPGSNISTAENPSYDYDAQGANGVEPTLRQGNVVADFKGLVGLYSFALKPEEHQPSGTCNFSRIDNAKLILTPGAIGSQSVVVYAVNYNVLRIMSGMGGLAYSN